MHLVRALASQGGHTLVALGLTAQPANIPKGVNYISYSLERGTTRQIHPYASETEAKVIRAEACAKAAYNLYKNGFTPDLICVHPGWGEGLFLSDVWPDTPLLAYQEFFYHTKDLDTDFDLDLQSNQTWEKKASIRMKNAYLHLSLEQASWNVTPTSFQRSTFPSCYQDRFSVIHDGVDVNRAVPLKQPPPITLSDGTVLSKGDPIVTFVNRSLEPYRGCHTFIRAIPELQRLVPEVRLVVVGSTTGVSYGAKCPRGEWKDYFLSEIQGDYDSSKVHFTETIAHDHFLSLLRVTACHVYLTYPFVLSWSLLEAMSSCCPIVASSTAPVQEVIRDGSNGLLVDFFSPGQLASSVAELLRNPELGCKLGQSARATIKSSYSLDVCVPRHLQLMSLVASRSIG